jgi:hypothetical protein
MATTDMTASTILALDLGNDKSAARAYQRDSALVALDSFTKGKLGDSLYLLMSQNIPELDLHSRVLSPFRNSS